MEQTLVLVTLFSLALALGMGVLVWRLLQDDRRRAEARVAALVDGFSQRPPVQTPAGGATSAARTAASRSAAFFTGDRGSAREADAEAPAFALRDADDRQADAAFASAHAPAAASASVLTEHAQETPDVQEADLEAAPVSPLRHVSLGGADKDWLLEFPSAVRPGETAPGAAAGAAGYDIHDTDDSSDDVERHRGSMPAFAQAGGRPGGHRAQPASAAARGWRDDGDARTVRIGEGDGDGADGEDDLPLASDSARELFGQVTQADERATTNRFTQVALLVALVAGFVLAIWTVSRLAIAVAQPSAAQGAAASAGAGTGTAGSTGAPGAAAAPPLELLALRYARDGNTLTINGLVRNPAGGTRQERLTAVVFFFNARGEFLTSARTPLDFRTLAPGDESPFQLTLAAPAGVGRYRVSFRHDEGGIVSHVDRRAAAAAPRAGS